MNSRAFILVVVISLVIPFLSVLANGSLSSSYAGVLVEVSTHSIDVDPGSFDVEGPVRLRATLYQPRFLTAAPAAVYIHGWGGRRLTGEDNLAYYIAAAGYIVLSYTARGFGEGESGGRVTLAGPDELNDLSRVIDWLTTDPDRVVGPRVTKVGIIGGSYGGGHSFQISSDPRVSAAIPLVGWTDLESALFPNGAINYRLGIAEFYSGLEMSTGQAPFFNYSRLQFDLFDAAAEGRLPANDVRDQLRARSIARPGQDGRLVLDQSRQPRAPVFIIQSWDDYLFPSTQVLDVFAQITAPKQIYLGRTGHPPGGNSFTGEEVYIGAQVLRWFDYHLRGIGRLDDAAVTSARAPFSVTQLPIEHFDAVDTTSLSLFMKAGGELSRKKKGPRRQETTGGIFFPEQIRSSNLGIEIPTQSDMLSGRVEALGTTPRQLEYTVGPFEEETEIVGSNEFTIFVSSATSSTVDLIARTYDVAPDGLTTEVTVGIVRIADLSQGEVRKVSFRDFGEHWIFRRGHSLKLTLSNIAFPEFRPPGANDHLASEITIHTGKSFKSKVRLPLRTR